MPRRTGRTRKDRAAQVGRTARLREQRLPRGKGFVTPGGVKHAPVNHHWPEGRMPDDETTFTQMAGSAETARQLACALIAVQRLADENIVREVKRRGLKVRTRAGDERDATEKDVADWRNLMQQGRVIAYGTPPPPMRLQRLGRHDGGAAARALESEAVRGEWAYRRSLWEELLARGGPMGVFPTVLRELGIYRAQQGIFRNKDRTADLTPAGSGVTLSLLHTGTVYADDLSEDGVIYHYPDTRRPGDHDQAEIQATKATKDLKLPLFVISYPEPSATTRDVRLGWVEDWDDASAVFLVTFGDEGAADSEHAPAPEEPFQLVEQRESSDRTVREQRGQQRFKLRVLQHYGPRCAVCAISVTSLLDAAHIRPRREDGSDDPRNGIVLCATHHRAFDATLFSIHPSTLGVRAAPRGPGLDALGIDRHSIDHLPRRPHREALEWLWRRRLQQDEQANS